MGSLLRRASIAELNRVANRQRRVDAIRQRTWQSGIKDTHHPATGLAPVVPALCSYGVERQNDVTIKVLPSVRGP